jgi:translation initiation factor 5B
VKHEEPLYGALLAFNVKILPDAEREARNQKIKIFWNDIIYNLMDDYIRWMEEEKEAKARKEFETLIQPGKIQLMDGFVFRRAKPAIFGVEILAGIIKPNVIMMNVQGDRIGRISQIQDNRESVSKAEEGKEVAIAMPQPIYGRHIKERDVLYVDIPEQHAKLLRTKFSERLTESAQTVLQELIELKRQKDMLWAV